MARLKGISVNLSAFLDMIAVSEGTFGHGDDGYNILVGGKKFTSYGHHPNVSVDLGHGLKSTAAGRYQILARYATAYSKALGLHDFSPESQDRIAIQMLKERKAISDIETGHITQAIAKARNIWASFPGAGYGQREHHLDTLLAAYQNARGEYAPAV